MNKFKGTPGPWEQLETMHGFLIYTSIVDELALVADDLFESEANAKLIAAAPELLEACQIVQEWNGKIMIKEDFNKVLEAIKKATE